MNTTLTIKGTTISQDDLALKTTGELATAYNSAMYEIDPQARKVDRFATKEAAVRRTWGAFVQLAALEQEGVAAMGDDKALANTNLNKPKKAKKAKAPKAEVTEGEKHAHGQFKGKTLCAVIGEEGNPRREGSHGHRSLQIIIDNPGIAYEDFVARGGRRVDLAWDVKNGNARIEN